MSIPKEVFPLKTLVEVYWLDARVRGSWASVETYAETTPLCQIRSAGYLFRKTKTELVLVQSQGTTGNVADSITIPRSCVTRIRRLT